MKLKLKHQRLLAYNRAKVLSVITAETNKKGFVETAEIEKLLSISGKDMADICDDLVAEGQIEEVKEVSP